MSLTEMEAPIPTRPIKAYETFSFYTAEGLATFESVMNLYSEGRSHFSRILGALGSFLFTFGS